MESGRARTPSCYWLGMTTMAREGQTGPHAPQPVQLEACVAGNPPRSTMARWGKGQASRQRVQASPWLRTHRAVSMWASPMRTCGAGVGVRAPVGQAHMHRPQRRQGALSGSR